LNDEERLLAAALSAAAFAFLLRDTFPPSIGVKLVIEHNPRYPAFQASVAFDRKFPTAHVDG